MDLNSATLPELELNSSMAAALFRKKWVGDVSRGDVLVPTSHYCFAVYDKIHFLSPWLTDFEINYDNDP